jgi:glucose/arabinose dehydrogenase
MPSVDVKFMSKKRVCATILATALVQLTGVAVSLAGQDVRRVQLDAAGKVKAQELIPVGKRVRDVRQGPDGQLYVLTDEAKGTLLRIVPK